MDLGKAITESRGFERQYLAIKSRRAARKKKVSVGAALLAGAGATAALLLSFWLMVAAHSAFGMAGIFAVFAAICFACFSGIAILAQLPD